MKIGALCRIRNDSNPLRSYFSVYKCESLELKESLTSHDFGDRIEMKTGTLFIALNECGPLCRTHERFWVIGLFPGGLVGTVARMNCEILK